MELSFKKLLFKDRLYEIDKSWKNNLMIYGVPCNENMEEDSIITEEKVRITFTTVEAGLCDHFGTDQK